jgi:hypothetical protein
MPLDEGGHSFNGLVAIHCDRMWGVTFRNVNVVNATNLRSQTQDWVHIFSKTPDICDMDLAQIDPDWESKPRDGSARRPYQCYRVPVVGYGATDLMLPTKTDKYALANSSWNHVQQFLPDSKTEPAFYGRFEWEHTATDRTKQTYTFPYEDVFGETPESTDAPRRAFRAFNGFCGSSWGFMMNDSGGNILENVNVLNMLGRGGVSFGIHAAFGSRGNIFRRCSVLSCTASQIWGFVADKGAGGNIYEDCVASGLIGGSAAAGFVLRGHDNVVRKSQILDMRVVVPDPTITSITGSSNIMSPYEEYQLFTPAHERVVISVLENHGGADEHEYIGRDVFENNYEDPSNIFMGTRVIYSSQLDRPTEISARLTPHRVVSVPSGYSLGRTLR